MSWIVGNIAKRMDTEVLMLTRKLAVSVFVRRIAHLASGFSALEDRGIFGHLLLLLTRRT